MLNTLARKTKLRSMNRRQFTLYTSLFGLGLGTSIPLLAKPLANTKKRFNLKYAPHIGMFKYSAGENPINQLKFMADNGFSAFEDNEMKNRPINIQNKIANVMIDRNITMGVFVAHEIAWKKPNLTSGDLNMRIAFLKQILFCSSGKQNDS